ncbi:hypothetical protein HpVH116_10480 [Helicobacter pylori]
MQATCKALIDLKQSKERFLTFIEELKRIVNFESKENMEEKIAMIRSITSSNKIFVKNLKKWMKI